MIHFRDTVQQKFRWKVRSKLTLEKDHALLSNNYELAYKRLDSTYKKLDKTGYREKYQQVFGEWVEEGVIEEVFLRRIVVAKVLITFLVSSYSKLSQE
ncbi:hypothetical protein TNCT_364301 [Trichonephila clavata]|uniref:Uncharacterized protein n=1 Tax=Trichonephila clavata TaxID=2740835 RepID=A0A8X6H2M1_TRICU|nr:hypothetical protein TNCT_364301 [Trichonephila clavata]